MQIDIGFGDVITPGPQAITYPTILGHPAPQLNGYNTATVIAEKFQAMVALGELNSRMKDFFDIFLLSETRTFKGDELVAAVGKTFANRGTAIEAKPICFSPSFGGDRAKQTQWAGFRRRNLLTSAPADFAEVVGRIATFLQPVAAAAKAAAPFPLHWTSGKWST